MSSARLPVFELRAAFEVSARHRVQLERERRLLQPRKRVGQVIDRVVRHRQRAVAAGIGRRQLEIGVQLLAGLDVQFTGLPFTEVTPPPSGLSANSASIRSRWLLQQPIDAIRFAALFVGRQRQDDVAVGPVALPLEADEGGDRSGVARPSCPACRGRRSSRPSRRTRTGWWSSPRGAPPPRPGGR